MITNMLRRVILGKKESFIFKCYTEEMIDFTEIGDEIGLYIHIPFCRSICPYCPYNKTLYQESQGPAYKAAILKELALYKEILTNRRVASIYIGGGTPTLLISELKEVLEFIKNNYHFHGDIGIEIHPREINQHLLCQLQEIGVNMVSLGVQTFNDEILKFLGRGYRAEEIDEALSLVAKYNFKCVDIDLMTNLPGQTMADVEYDLRRVYSYQIDQVSIYPLIVFPLTNMDQVIKKNHLHQLSSWQEGRLLKKIDDISRERGYIRTSVWTYGKNEQNKYTSVTRESFIGLGAGASTLFGRYFYLNTFDVKEYMKTVDQNRLPINVVNIMSEKEKMIFWIFWRCYEGAIDQQRFQELFGQDMEQEFKFLFKALAYLGLSRRKENRVVLTELGRYAYHWVEKQYSLYYLNHLWQKSMEQPWLKEVSL